jgi:hypothetical protein
MGFSEVRWTSGLWGRSSAAPEAGEVPFPEPFDDPKAPGQVCELVDLFIIKSPFNLKAFCESLPNKVITL